VSWFGARVRFGGLYWFYWKKEHRHIRRLRTEEYLFAGSNAEKAVCILQTTTSMLQTPISALQAGKAQLKGSSSATESFRSVLASGHILPI
jgi:hypothetical protein